METSVEVDRPVEPSSRSSELPGESTCSQHAQGIDAHPPTAGDEASRISIDPMRPTDRYRLVLPCDRPI